MTKPIADSEKEGHEGRTIGYIADKENVNSKIFIIHSVSPLRGTRWLHKYTRLSFFIILTLLLVLLILSAAIYLLLVQYAPQNNFGGIKTEKLNTSNSTEYTSDTIIVNLVSSGTENPSVHSIDPDALQNISQIRIVSRIEWFAAPPIEKAEKLQKPVPYVIITHTATENCTSRVQCNFLVRYIQTYHMEGMNFWDIGFNFAVGGDGNAYEGRGWESVGAHTYGYNARSIGIAFIGTFNKITPPERQMTACKQLIAKGVELGYISKNYKLLAARQLQTTESPGELFYKEMKNWPHWSSTP